MAIKSSAALLSEKNISAALSTALRDVFGEHTSSGRFVDVSRIPLLCKSVLDTNDKIKEINDKLDNKFVSQESFIPVRNLVFGLVGLILTAMVLAIVSIVLE